jgi:hypothetical protein
VHRHLGVLTAPSPRLDQRTVTVVADPDTVLGRDRVVPPPAARHG